jgi:hypothetical protein
LMRADRQARGIASEKRINHNFDEADCPAASFASSAASISSQTSSRFPPSATILK